jgi:hypothetical protein
MFLSGFRLPGEAQQIDRIIQAFSESCGICCQEYLTGGILSSDPKRAVDTVYLLSFSIIMLNTDLHNPNIRPDRKMSQAAFIKNNTYYGEDIMEKGKELPRETLVGIYESIRDEEVRIGKSKTATAPTPLTQQSLPSGGSLLSSPQIITKSEGPKGDGMTIDRWKDTLRSATHNGPSSLTFLPPGSYNAAKINRQVIGKN